MKRTTAEECFSSKLTSSDSLSLHQQLDTASSHVMHNHYQSEIYPSGLKTSRR